MNPFIVYKLTDPNLRTYNEFQWVLRQWAPPLDGKFLCTSGVYHAYHTIELALLLSPIHVIYSDNFRLWEAEVRGRIIYDHGLKLGATEMRLIRELPFTPPTIEQRVLFALFCAKESCKEPEFVTFADNWISGKDRTEITARNTARALQSPTSQPKTWRNIAPAVHAAHAADAFFHASQLHGDIQTVLVETANTAANAAKAAQSSAILTALDAAIATGLRYDIQTVLVATANTATHAARVAQYPLVMLMRCAEQAYALTQPRPKNTIEAADKFNPIAASWKNKIIENNP